MILHLCPHCKTQCALPRPRYATIHPEKCSIPFSCSCCSTEWLNTYVLEHITIQRIR